MKQCKLPPKLTEWEHVSIHWQDAHETEGTHVAAHYIANFKPVYRKTSGYVLHYGPEYIVTAKTDDREGKQEDGDDDCESIFSIPICMVRKIVRR